MNIISSTERLGMAEKKLNNAAPTFPNLLSRHRLGYVHIWRYAGGVAIPLSTSDVTIYCVTLRWFSNLPSAKQSQAIKQAKPSWFRPQLSYLHQCPSQDTDHNIRRTVFSFGNEMTKQSLQILQIVFTSYHWSRCLILDHFTSHGKHKDVTEKYALSKYYPDKRRQKTLCLSNRLKIRMNTHFWERKFTFRNLFIASKGCKGTCYKCPTMKQPLRPDVGRVHRDPPACLAFHHAFFADTKWTTQGQKNGRNTLNIPVSLWSWVKGVTSVEEEDQSEAVVCWNWPQLPVEGWCH